MLRSWLSTEDNWTEDEFLDFLSVRAEKIPDPEVVSHIEHLMKELLTEKENEVLRAWITWLSLDNTQDRMDRDELGFLCKSLDSTPESIRQTKRRALAKLKAALE